MKAVVANVFPFLPFHDARDDLRGAAITDAHRQNHAVEFVETGVVQVKQHRSHAEAKQPEGGRIACRVLNLSNRFVHKPDSLRVMQRQ